MHESFARLKPCVAHFSPLHPPVAVNMRNRPSARANSDDSVTSIWGREVGAHTSPSPEESSENRSALAVPPMAGDVFLMSHFGERQSFVRLNPDMTCSLMTLYRWDEPKVATPLNSTWSVRGPNNLRFTCRCYDEKDKEAIHSLIALADAGWVVEPPFGAGLHQDRSRMLHRDLLRQCVPRWGWLRFLVV